MYKYNQYNYIYEKSMVKNGKTIKESTYYLEFQGVQP